MPILGDTGSHVVYLFCCQRYSNSNCRKEGEKEESVKIPPHFKSHLCYLQPCPSSSALGGRGRLASFPGAHVLENEARSRSTCIYILQVHTEVVNFNYVNSKLSAMTSRISLTRKLSILQSTSLLFKPFMTEHLKLRSCIHQQCK